MKKKSPYFIVLAILIFSTLYLRNSTVEAYHFESNYDLSTCIIEFPDGTHHRGAHCWAPNPQGPCNGATVCMNGAPPPQVE